MLLEEFVKSRLGDPEPELLVSPLRVEFNRRDDVVVRLRRDRLRSVPVIEYEDDAIGLKRSSQIYSNNRGGYFLPGRRP